MLMLLLISSNDQKKIYPIKYILLHFSGISQDWNAPIVAVCHLIYWLLSILVADLWIPFFKIVAERKREDVRESFRDNSIRK